MHPYPSAIRVLAAHVGAHSPQMTIATRALLHATPGRA